MQTVHARRPVTQPFDPYLTEHGGQSAFVQALLGALHFVGSAYRPRRWPRPAAVHLRLKQHAHKLPAPLGERALQLRVTELAPPPAAAARRWPAAGRSTPPWARRLHAGAPRPYARARWCGPNAPSWPPDNSGHYSGSRRPASPPAAAPPRSAPASPCTGAAARARAPHWPGWQYGPKAV